MSRFSAYRVRGHRYVSAAPVTPELLLAASEAASRLTDSIVTAEATESGNVRLAGTVEAVSALVRRLEFTAWVQPTASFSVDAIQRLIAQAGVARALAVVSDAAIDVEAPTLSSDEIVRLQDEADDAAETARRLGR